MSIADTARKNYEMARIELVERIRLRDNVLLVYLAVVGTVFTIALGATAKPEILLTIPYLAMGCSILVSQHNSVIGTLLAFCTRELKPILQNLHPSEYAPEFGSSKSFKEHSMRSNIFRTTGHAVIVIVPCIVALSYNWQRGFKSPFPVRIVWWFALVCTIFSIFVIRYVHGLRTKVYADTLWDE